MRNAICQNTSLTPFPFGATCQPGKTLIVRFFKTVLPVGGRGPVADKGDRLKSKGNPPVKSGRAASLSL
jgi:hypothetical protein